MTQSSDPDFSVAPGAEILSDSRCFVCGLDNAGGLAVRFYRDGESGARAVCEPDRRFMGYHGLLHGGVAASLLDEIMIKAVLARGKLVVTGRMSIQYHRPVELGQKLVLRGRVKRERGRLVEVRGELRDEKGRELVSSTGTYVELRGDQRQELMNSLGALQEN